MNYVFKFSGYLSNMVDIYFGNFKSNTPEVEEIKKDLFDVSVIPTPANDKKALREDFNLFLKDVKKAQTKLKAKTQKNG